MSDHQNSSAASEGAKRWTPEEFWDRLGNVIGIFEADAVRLQMETHGLRVTPDDAQAVGMLTRYGEPAIPLAIKAIKAWQANRATSYTPTDILIDCGDAILAALAAQPLAAPVERKRKFTVCGDCGLDEHCGDRCPNTPLARSSAVTGDDA